MQSGNKIILETFGSRIKELRTAKGLTLRDLYAASGVDFSYIGDIEKGEGNPSLLILFKLAAALDVPVEDLVKMPNPFVQL